ncbi:hypothetical protein [Comamonas thiooxydans]|uniref:hypothetical protein n=1 Tax=Comamonas thiooxydans TaxID=363952 RepID=UPI000B40C6BB|nr:hypothetical protein [Comamonas thiooxydans]
MKTIHIIYAAFVGLALFFGAGVHAQDHSPIYGVVAQDVDVKFDGQGEMRFCEKAHVRRGVCGFEQKLFGKSKFAARDWWTPATYIQATTGRSKFTVIGVEPTENGQGLKIFFQFN